MPRGYIASETSIHFMNYHFVWCPKYRRKVLVNKIAKRLEELIHEKAGDLSCNVISLSIQPDHTHLFIRAHPRISPNSLIGQIKGYTSRILRQEFPELKRKLPTLWTRSYFVSTHGHVSNKMIQKYIEEQRGR
ncbi:MAG: IS200/IS605 family transposase [Thermotoga sp.]|nr:MAG: IS200/IS605 family transposase [Thermotoga sp.]